MADPQIPDAEDRRNVISEAIKEASAEPAPEPIETEAPALEEAPPPAPTTERARDAAGRFVAKDEAEEAAPEKPAEKSKLTAAPKPEEAAPAPEVKPPESAAPPPQPKEAQLAGSEKAPASWKPLAKEQWASLPDVVRQEWSRREKEMTAYIQNTNESRKIVEEVHRSLAPYESIARANGQDAMSYAGTVLQAAAALQMGAPAQKAAIIANLIGTYGVDVDAVNEAMQRGPQPIAPQAQPVNVQAEIARALEEREAQWEYAHNLQAVQEFEANPPEFWDDLKSAVADRLKFDRMRGGNMTLKQAYDLELRYSDDHQKILGQRKASEEAKKKAEEAQRAKTAAGSIRNQPSGPAPAREMSLRETLAEEIRKAGG